MHFYIRATPGSNPDDGRDIFYITKSGIETVWPDLDTFERSWLYFLQKWTKYFVTFLAVLNNHFLI